MNTPADIRKMKNGHLVNSIKWCDRRGPSCDEYKKMLCAERDRREIEGWDDGNTEVKTTKTYTVLVDIDLPATSREDAEKGVLDALAKLDIDGVSFELIDVSPKE